ncbi:hypothetical protein [Saccharospirillum alexandrii]|uniref:hypothetical protein n=1 Tax=Saccharospirillum alexandrii TaxID=2448477 RepID=UPI0037354A1F
MKRILLLLLIIVVGGYGAAHWHVTRTVQSQLDEAALMAEGVGRLTYGQIWVIPTGEIRVHNLAFSAHGQGGDVRIERASLETANLLELVQLGQTLSNDEIPQRLALRLSGIELDLDSMRPLVDNNAQQHMLAAGCGDERTYFNFTDLDTMGYRQTRSDMTLEYRLTPERDNLQVEGEFTTESMYRMSTRLEVALADAQGPAALMGATLNQVQIRVDDLGYVPEVMSFCARETGLDVDTYKTRHVNAWEQLWQEQGVVLADNVVEAYAAYIEQPESLRVESFARLNAMQMMMVSDPQAILDLIAPQIVVNDGQPSPLQLTLALPQRVPEPDTAQSQPEAPQAEPERPAPEPAQTEQAPRVIEVPVSDLADWLNSDMIINLADGREFRGEIESLNNDELQFKQSVFGGTMVMPVARDAIRRVRVVNP